MAILFVVNIFLSIAAVIMGIMALVFFFIGFADDPDMYVPGVMWAMLAISCVSLSYLISAA